MVVLDTDHVSLLEREDSDSAIMLLGRLRQGSDGVIRTTIVTYEEQTRGWLAVLGRARKLKDQIAAFDRLFRHMVHYRVIDVLPFDNEAGESYEHIRSHALLLSRNFKDFRRVPRLRVEDWTR